jgi:Cft2 family RNA processing exonuclease
MKRQREETGNQDYPLYVETDVERVEHALAAVPIANPRMIGRGGEEVALTFHLAGHVAGAVGCLIEHRKKKHFFTGDVHFKAQRTVAAANFPRTPVDTLVMECTRGATATVPGFDRGKEEQRLIKAVNAICDDGGSVLLPAFAFGRMQEILMLLQEAADAGNLADVPIFCSGLGMDLCDYLDAASKKTKQVKFSRQVLRDLGILPLSRKYTQPGKNMPERGIYLLSSGMLVEKTPAWRVAANMLDHEENAVFFVGYCDPETPGGELIGMSPGGEFKFKSLDHTSTLRAKVERFHLSGHADREELLDFAKALEPKDIVLTHGDPPARAWMKETLAAAMPGTRVHDPAPGVPLEL